LSVYLEQTQPLEEYYKKLGKLVNVDGSKDLAVVTKEILNILKG
jgi:adenylate kinase family enzyme